jgi:hypothetical protein
LNALTFGINFSTCKDEFISCWFRTPQESVDRGELMLEVDGYGVPALFAKPNEQGSWMANFRLPPGLTGGWKSARRNNVHVTAGDTRLSVWYAGAPDDEGRRQINAALPRHLRRGMQPFIVECGGVSSESRPQNVVIE